MDELGVDEAIESPLCCAGSRRPFEKPLRVDFLEMTRTPRYLPSIVKWVLRVRGCTWLLSMLWAMTGAVVTGYYFYATTPNYASADVMGTGFLGFNAGSAFVQIVAVLAGVVWVALPLPLLIAGFIRLRGWRPANWLRAAAWAATWTAGAVLLALAHSLAESSYGVDVSWGELPICVAWLALAALMTWILGVAPAGRSDALSPGSRADVTAN